MLLNNDTHNTRLLNLTVIFKGYSMNTYKVTTFNNNGTLVDVLTWML